MRILIGVVALTLCAAAPARAQWYAGTYVGANHNSPESITLDQPSLNTSVVFHDVNFRSEPFHFPLYWGARIGKLTHGKRVGFEFEFLHLKVIAQTAQSFLTTGTLRGASIDETMRMDTLVQRYNMTHGTNFFMGNIVLRTPLGHLSGRPVTLVARAGGGPVITGTDTQVGFSEFSHYQFAGYGGAASAGIDIPIAGAWSAIAEYKFAIADPHITVANGTGHTTVVSNQVAFGLTLGFGG